MARLSLAGAQREPPMVALTLVRLKHPDDWLRRALLVLSDTERSAVASMAGDDARVQHAVGRALIRLIGADASGRDPSGVDVVLSDSGKPQLANVSGLHVSVAHTSGLVVTAASRHAPVGVDVEHEPMGTHDPRRVARRLFSATEVEALKDLPDAELGSWFASAWTIKEAVGKALGVGMVPALSGAVLERNGEGLTLKSVWSGPPAERWTIHQLRAPGGDERIAVALPAPNVALGPVSWLTLADFPG